VAVTGLLAAGCGQSAGQVAAVVNGVTISRAQLDAELSAMAANPRFLAGLAVNGSVRGSSDNGFSPAFVAQVLSNEIQVEVIKQEAGRRGVSLAPALAMAVTEANFAETYPEVPFAAFPLSYREELAARTGADLALSASLAGVSITPAALTAYYRAQLPTITTYCVSAILTASESAAQALRTRLAAGAPFAAMAHADSLDPTGAANDGALGCQQPSAFDPTLARAVVELHPGGLSPPVHDAEGWYLLDLTRESVPTFGAAAVQLLSQLVPSTQALQSFVDHELAVARVTVDPRYGTFDPREAPPQVVAPTPAPAGS
jgi:hypothetical protein